MNRPGLFKKETLPDFINNGLELLCDQDNVGNLCVYRDKAGYSQIYCNCDRSLKFQWCEHQEQIIKSGNDIQYLGNLINVIVYARPWLIIPVSLNYTLKKYDYDGDITRAIVKSSYNSDDWFIGYIDTTDGTKMLRKMLIEWLHGIPEFTELICSAPTHWKGDSKLENFFGLRDHLSPLELKSITVDIWELYTSRVCRSCKDVYNIPDITDTSRTKERL